MVVAFCMSDILAKELKSEVFRPVDGGRVNLVLHLVRWIHADGLLNLGLTHPLRPSVEDVLGNPLIVLDPDLVPQHPDDVEPRCQRGW